jgi:formate dehydrogenase iron-sulfur subunit
VYGEREIGGTNVMFLSALPFEQLGFPRTLPDAPMPDLTWQALSKIPTIVSVGGLSLLGIWWIIERRMRVERIGDEAAAGAHGAVLKFKSPAPDASQSKRGAS